MIVKDLVVWGCCTITMFIGDLFLNYGLRMNAVQYQYADLWIGIGLGLVICGVFAAGFYIGTIWRNKKKQTKEFAE